MKTINQFPHAVDEHENIWIERSDGCGMTGPTFLCIGAQKSGTTWLYRALEKRPDVWPVSYTHLTLPTTLCMCRSRWSRCR